MRHLAEYILVLLVGGGLLGAISWTAVGAVAAVLAFLDSREGKE